jgi:hypothetical protein
MLSTLSRLLFMLFACRVYEMEQVVHTIGGFRHCQDSRSRLWTIGLRVSTMVWPVNVSIVKARKTMRHLPVDGAVVVAEGWLVGIKTGVPEASGVERTADGKWSTG